MLSIFTKSTSSTAANIDDLSTWELVHPSDDDDDDDLFYFEGGDDRATTDEDGVITKQDDGDGENTLAQDGVVPLKDVMAIESLSMSPPTTFPLELTRHNEEVYGYDEDDGVDDGIDDDLVPWKLKDRFGKQRLKKMGKRGMGPKFTNNTKRVPHYYYNKPAYVYTRPSSMHLTYV